MKPILSVLIIFCLLCGLTACSSENDREILDRIVDENGDNPIVFGMTPEEVADILGQPDAGGYYREGTLIVSYDLADDVVKEITLLTGTSYRLPNGISIESSRQDILDKMGDPQGMDEQTIAYLYNETGEIPEDQMDVHFSVQFAMSGDAIQSITLLKFRHGA